MQRGRGETVMKHFNYASTSHGVIQKNDDVLFSIMLYCMYLLTIFVLFFMFH